MQKRIHAISVFISVLVCALTLAVRSEAGTMYAASAAGGSGELYIINPANGNLVQDVGPLNDSLLVNYPVTGLAFHPVSGLLYGSTGNSVLATAAKLIVINPATAQVTVIGAFNAGPVNGSGTPATMADIGFDAAGNLYGVGSIGGPQLYSINIGTGQATVIGGTGFSSTSGGGLAISPGGVFYGTPTSSRFGTYNTISGAFVTITNPTKPVGGAYAALEFDENGVLFGLNLGPGPTLANHLVTINPVNGAVTDLGPSDLTSLDAIAVIPEPSTTVLLLGAAVVGVMVRARRQK